MKKILFLFCLTAFVACNSANEAKVESVSSKDSSEVAADSISYQYSADYSSKFEMGNPKNVKTIFDLYTDWDNNNLDNSKNEFADSVTLIFSNGDMMAGKIDSLTELSKTFRNTLGTVNTKVHAVVPLRSTDKNEDWVLVWFTEYRTDAKGKKDSIQFQETWRLDKDGRADKLYQYEQKNIASAKK